MDKIRCFFGALCLFFVLKEGITCNPEWKLHNGTCYKIISFRQDFRLARRYCQILRADVAVIRSQEEVAFIETLDHYVNTTSYWLGENSSLTQTEDSEERRGNFCPFLSEMDRSDSPSLPYDSCDEAKFFICEYNLRISRFTCPEDWFLYGVTCYKPVYKGFKTYEESKTFCGEINGRLAVLSDISYEHEAAPVIIGRNSTFLVAATRDQNGTFVWESGEPFEPSCPQCVLSSTGNCLGFQSRPEHPTVFSWIQVDCKELYPFLCQRLPTTSTPSPTTRTATTTLSPLQCPVGFNWEEHEVSGFCYWETTYEAERLNWYQAREFCQEYGGDLATYHDEEQEKLGLGGAKGHYRGLWFGLKRSKDNVFEWVDDSVLNYTNWSGYEPKLRSSSKFCVMHGAGNSKWELDYCGVRRWFICKAPKTRRPILPETGKLFKTRRPILPETAKLFKRTRCNITGASIYRNDWFQHKDHCYLVREISKFSWDTAQNFCNDNGGYLASIHSFEETDAIISLSASLVSDSFWIGLAARGVGSSLEWSDGTPLNFMYWEDGFVYNGTQFSSVCTTFDRNRGFWKVNHCNQLRGVICKRGLNATYEFTTPEPTPLLPGNCQKGWYLLGNMCYKIYGRKRSQRLDFNGAQESCRSEEAELASIHSDEQQDFLTDLLLVAGTDVRIGLHSANQGTVFIWTDDSPMDYTNWNSIPFFSSSLIQWEDDSDDSDRAVHKCVELSYAHDFMGKWTERSCAVEMAYACQKPKDPNLKDPSDDPFKCTNISGWLQMGSSCFGIFENEELNWLNAQKKCRSFGANLVSFRSSSTPTLLKKKITLKDNFLWTGIRELKPNTYKYLIPRITQFTNWLREQPRGVSDRMENCVSINADAKWIVRQCQENHGFVCEWNPEGEQEEDILDMDYSCPNTSEWEDLGGKMCYLIQTDLVLTWNDANTYCFRHGGSLASFHSSQEITAVLDRIMLETSSPSPFSPGYHIGLGKRKDQSFAWVDGSPVDYVNWASDYLITKDCVQMMLSGKWMFTDCDRMTRSFICSALKQGSTHREPIASQTTNDISKKLTIGGIFGIVICLLVVLAIAGVTAYYLCPSTRVRVGLIEAESL